MQSSHRVRQSVGRCLLSTWGGAQQEARDGCSDCNLSECVTPPRSETHVSAAEAPHLRSRLHLPNFSLTPLKRPNTRAESARPGFWNTVNAGDSTDGQKTRSYDEGSRSTLLGRIECQSGTWGFLFFFANLFFEPLDEGRETVKAPESMLGFSSRLRQIIFCKFTVTSVLFSV